MNGRQELQRVISLFDMTKVDLPSFNLSMSKFDEVAHAYSKVMLLASIVTLNETEEDDDAIKRREIAVKTLSKLVANPKAYCYEECSRSERELVNKAAEDAWGYMPASKRVNQVKEKAKNNLMVKNLKHIVSCLQNAVETYPDVLLDRYMDDAIFFDTLAKFREKEEAVSKRSFDDSVPSDTVDSCDTAEIATDEQNETEVVAKQSVWQKILSIFRMR